jgi:hydroxymethylbilane synthase
MSQNRAPIYIATRGSALALAQARSVAAQCAVAFPDLHFELKIIKTTGDKLQTASLSNAASTLPKGLFTKELELALSRNEATLAVHSLKDLPTGLPAGLVLGAVGKRADARDVLLCRHDFRISNTADPLASLPRGAVVATSSTRRKAQLLDARPDLEIVEIRCNVPTRLQKLATQDTLSATILALAGMHRLNYSITPDGRLSGESVPGGLTAIPLPEDQMLPCVGQGAIGIEIREDDGQAAALCARLNDAETFQCVLAERTFLHTMGGGCQSPVAAHATTSGGDIRLRAVSFRDGPARRASGVRPFSAAEVLGREVAAQLQQTGGS